MGTRPLSTGVEWPGCEADHLPSPSAEVKQEKSYVVFFRCCDTVLHFHSPSSLTVKKSCNDNISNILHSNQKQYLTNHRELFDERPRTHAHTRTNTAIGSNLISQLSEQRSPQYHFVPHIRSKFAIFTYYTDVTLGDNCDGGR